MPLMVLSETDDVVTKVDIYQKGSIIHTERGSTIKLGIETSEYMEFRPGDKIRVNVTIEKVE